MNDRNLIGKKFGRLIVISLKRKSEGEYKTYYNCKCTCGKKTKVYKSNLLLGNSTSCGCLRIEYIQSTYFIDITGKKFGRLTVLEFVGHKNNKAYFKVKCKCGNISYTQGYNLRNGITKSCGCLLGGQMKSRTNKINRNSKKKLNKPVKIDIGAGDKNKQTPLEDWIHIDGVMSYHIEIVCDFAEIPMKDGEADEIFSGDTIEHIIMQKRDQTLREWNRIMKVGGVFSGRCPNLHSTMIRYAKGELSLHDATGALYGSQDSIWQQHYITYTSNTLKELLEKYGFGEIDLSGSPGSDNPYDAWWLVWTCKKIKNV